jgi:PAS domain-containing protein
MRMQDGADRSADLRRDAGFAALLAGSFRRLVGRPLGGGVAPAALWLYRDAPFCLLAHDGAAEPCFIYANEAAQACFGYTWEEFLRLPSRLSAEAPARDERKRLLEMVKRQGFIEDYHGVRVTKSGRRFLIEQAVVWELIDELGARYGQAAMFRAGHDLTE